MEFISYAIQYYVFFKKHEFFVFQFIHAKSKGL